MEVNFFIVKLISFIDHIQKFVEAKHPAIPFTFRIEYDAYDDDIFEEQKLSKRKTNEVLSIAPNIKYEGWMVTEIKRSMKQKQNSQPKL